MALLMNSWYLVVGHYQVHADGDDRDGESPLVTTKMMVAMMIQWCIIRLTCSHPELTKDHVLTKVRMLKIFEPSREMP